MHRGNRFLVGVVMGGRSGGSRDATMRNLLAENLEKAATKRTVAAITERNRRRQCRVAERGRSPTEPIQAHGAVQRLQPLRRSGRAPAPAPSRRSVRRRAGRSRPPSQAKLEPAPLTSA